MVDVKDYEVVVELKGMEDSQDYEANTDSQMVVVKDYEVVFELKGMEDSQDYEANTDSQMVVVKEASPTAKSLATVSLNEV